MQAKHPDVEPLNSVRGHRNGSLSSGLPQVAAAGDADNSSLGKARNLSKHSLLTPSGLHEVAGSNLNVSRGATKLKTAVSAAGIPTHNYKSNVNTNLPQSPLSSKLRMPPKGGSNTRHAHTKSTSGIHETDGIVS